jgi:hypothetical protein
MQACRTATESRKSINANSDRLRPYLTSRALASLGVHPCRLAIRFRRFPLSLDRRMLTTTDRVFRIKPFLLQRKCCKHCGISRWIARARLAMESCLHDDLGFLLLWSGWCHKTWGNTRRVCAVPSRSRHGERVTFGLTRTQRTESGRFRILRSAPKSGWIS